MTSSKIGQYVHANSFIHLLDPRTKIICCILLVFAVLMNRNMIYLVLLIIFIAFVIILSHLNRMSIFKSLLKLKHLLLFTLVFQAILTPGQALIVFGKIIVTKEGLTVGIINILRLVILFLGSMVLLMTTSPIKLTVGIEYLLLPLRKFKIPIHDFTTILSISLRFLPTLFEEALTIKNAQKSRGAQFNSPKILVRIKSYVAILIPLFESSLVRAAELGTAMDSRCYTSHPNQLRISSLEMTANDILTLVVTGFIFFAGILINIFLRQGLL